MPHTPMDSLEWPTTLTSSKPSETTKQWTCLCLSMSAHGRSTTALSMRLGRLYKWVIFQQLIPWKCNSCKSTCALLTAHSSRSKLFRTLASKFKKMEQHQLLYKVTSMPCSNQLAVRRCAPSSSGTYHQRRAKLSCRTPTRDPPELVKLAEL